MERPNKRAWKDHLERTLRLAIASGDLNGRTMHPPQIASTLTSTSIGRETSELGVTIIDGARLGKRTSRVNDCKAIGGSGGGKTIAPRVGRVRTVRAVGDQSSAAPKRQRASLEGSLITDHRYHRSLLTVHSSPGKRRLQNRCTVAQNGSFKPPDLPPSPPAPSLRMSWPRFSRPAKS